MLKRWGAIIGGLAIAISLFGASGAAAFTEVGNNCAADSAPFPTMVQKDQTEDSPLPIEVPSAGVVTKWRVNAQNGLEPTQEQLEVFRPTATVGSFEAVAESSMESLAAGQNVFSTRVPVQPGYRFGAHGAPVGYVCSDPDAENAVFGAFGEPSVGAIFAFEGVIANARAAVSAIVEPDADNDGYGDETQDFCPTDASTHGACPSGSSSGSGTPAPTTAPLPPLRVQALALRPGRRVVRMLVATSYRAEIVAGGQVGWGFKTKKHKRSHLIVGLNGGERTIAAGRIAVFRVRLPRAVLRRLHRLTPRQFLRARLSAVATDSSGRTATDRLLVKLRGRARRR